MKAITRMGALVALATAASLATAQNNISVSVNGKLVAFQDTGPRYVGGRVLVPVRGVFEEMGAMVDWNPASRTVTAVSGDQNVKLGIGDRTAYVNGAARTLDVPAMIINGRTMVPLRFISESIGADVEWIDATRQVVITTNDVTTTTTTTTSELKREPRMLARGTVIPVVLNDTISSNGSNRNDTFTATVRTANDTDYAGIPAGSKVEGHVVMVRPKAGSDPGLIELEFDRIRMPDGRTVNLNGEPIDLNSNDIAKNENGVLTAKTDRKDDKLVWAGYGAGAGLIVGLLTKRPLEGALIGGLLGLLVGVTNADKQNPRDVTLTPGTEFGVRLTSDAWI